MSSINYKTTIGAFTAIGLLLFFIGLVFLGGQKLFSSQSEYVLYFEGSVAGLSVGSPVLFRGVPLGNVSRINVVFNPRSSEITIPVFIKIDENRIIRTSGKEIPNVYQDEIIRHMVQNGLCASLQVHSFVTGQYDIVLDYDASSPKIFRSNTPDHEIPTVPSPIDKLQQDLAQLPLAELCDSLKAILASLANGLQDGSDLKNAIASFHGTFSEAEGILKASNLRTASKNITQNFDSSVAAVSREIPVLLASLRSTLGEIHEASTSIKKAAGFTQGVMNANSPANQDVRRLLKEASEAARSLHNFADMLNRNPEALISGKKGGR